MPRECEIVIRENETLDGVALGDDADEDEPSMMDELGTVVGANGPEGLKDARRKHSSTPSYGGVRARRRISVL